MKRGIRLRNRIDIERVRRNGKSLAHPLIVLLYNTNDLATSRFGVAAGRNIGNAVVRNRAKRRIRAVLSPMVQDIAAGQDLFFIARKPISKATPSDLASAVRQLLQRAQLLTNQ